MTKQEMFESLLSSITREGADVDGLLQCLHNNNFFTAPASTKYHNPYCGGLCEHSLHTYDILVDLVEQYCADKYSDDTLKIVALLHDISKSNYYVEEVKNRKVYCSNGSKVDSIGNYEWESYQAYSINSPENRTLFGTLEENTYYIVSQYIPLTLEEATALINCYGGCDGSSSSMNKDLSIIFRKSPLVALLHTADFLATYLMGGYE